MLGAITGPFVSAVIFTYRFRLLVPLSLATILTSGCQATVGNYFANRARDFGECFRLQAGADLGIGATVNIAGHLHMGTAVALTPRDLGVGWAYGDGYAFGYGRTGHTWDGELDTSLLAISVMLAGVLGGHAVPVPVIHTRSEASPVASLKGYNVEHACMMFFPAFTARVAKPYPQMPEQLTRQGGTPDALDDLGDFSFDSFEEIEPEPQRPIDPWKNPPLWSEEALKINPHAHVHAFDIEASVYAGVVYAKAGFSPGEFVDFLLGWFGVDIAGDDRGMGPEEKPVAYVREGL